MPYAGADRLTGMHTKTARFWPQGRDEAASSSRLTMSIAHRGVAAANTSRLVPALRMRDAAAPAR